MGSGCQRGRMHKWNFTPIFFSELKYLFDGETLEIILLFLGEKNVRNTYLLFLLVEIIYDDTNKQVQGEEGPKDDENNKVKIHVQTFLILRLEFHLSKENIL